MPMRAITIFWSSLAFMSGLLATQAGAQTDPQHQYWDFKDWRVMVTKVDTGEDFRIICRAWTGGDGDPTFGLEVSNGDALPPDHYPMPSLRESAPRGYGTMMRDGAWLLFEADVLVDVDTPWRVDATARTWRDEDGFLQAEAYPNGDGLDLLRVMREAGKMWITMDGEVVYGASLSGFTAAYGKIAEQCGFPTTGVID
jgi:hypothetical protein